MMFPWDNHLIVCTCGCPKNRLVGRAFNCFSCGKARIHGDTVFGVEWSRYEKLFQEKLYVTGAEYNTWHWELWTVN